jgi:hypothetical protein
MRRLNSALKARRFALGRTSVGGTTGRSLSVIVMDHLIRRPAQ